MRASAWWRRREEPARSEPTPVVARRPSDPVEHGSPTPWLIDAEVAPPAEVDPERAAEYSAWADRLRERREATKRRMNGEEVEVGTYWSAEHVFRESERVAEAELATRPDPLVLTGKLSVLGLDGSASTDDIERAYRRLAKQHHPDFHHDADEQTRAYHTEQMRQVNEAYHALKRVR